MGREVTCEHGLPVRPDDPFPAGQSPYCRPCWVAMGGIGSAPPSDPCEFRGPPRRKHGSVRLWYACGHPDQPLGDVVCACTKPVGCGGRCPGYSPPLTNSTPEED